MTNIVDVQKSIEAANGNVNLAKDLFTMLFNELDTRLKQIETCFQNNDLQGLAEYTHKLYGATAYCIVPELRITTEKLENALSDNALTKLDDLVDQLRSAIQNLINEGPRFIEMDWGR